MTGSSQPPSPPPIRPAAFHGSSSASYGGPAQQRIALRRSALLYGASAGFILIAVAAVCTALFPHMAPAQLAVAALATLGVLCAALVRDERSRPASLKSGPDGLSVWNRAGEPIVQGRVVGCAQWSGWLLALALVSDNGRSRTLLIAADMLPADLFRELAVQARRAAQG